MAKNSLVIPFDKDGNPQSYPLRYEQYELRPNYVFDDGLALIGEQYARSCSAFLLYSVNDGKEYVTSAAEFIKASRIATIYQQEIKHREFRHKKKWCLVLACHWTFCKKGNRYFLKAVDPEAL